MTQISAITAMHDAAASFREPSQQIWRQALPYIMLLVALGLLATVIAVANPLVFADIFGEF